MLQPASNQEFLVGIYRNTPEQLPWLSAIADVASGLECDIKMLAPDKVRLHLYGRRELGSLSIGSFTEAEELRKELLDSVTPSFHDEVPVEIAGLVIDQIGHSGPRSLMMCTKPVPTLVRERDDMMQVLPWPDCDTETEHAKMKFRLRLGAVLSGTISPRDLQEKLRPAAPKNLRLQKGKVKTVQ